MTRDRLVTFWKSQKGNKKIMRNISLGKWHFYSLDSGISISPKGSEPLTLEQSSLSQLDAQARPLILWCCRFLVKGVFFFFFFCQLSDIERSLNAIRVECTPGLCSWLLDEWRGRPSSGSLCSPVCPHDCIYSSVPFNIPFIGTGLYCKNPSVRF